MHFQENDVLIAPFSFEEEARFNLKWSFILK